MDYLIEAKKFVQQARHSQNPEVITTDLEMAEWLLSRAIEERDERLMQPTRRNADSAVEQPPAGGEG